MRAVIRQATTVLVLLTMAFLYGFVVDIIESAVPLPVPCGSEFLASMHN